MMIIDNKFEIGSIVYLKTDDDQKRRQVTGIKVCPDNSLLYEIICGTIVTNHYEMELTGEENILVKV